MNQIESSLWVEKYRPKTIEDIILPEKIKSVFRTFVQQKNIPHLLLSGGPGTGKTTSAKALVEELGCDYIFNNTSLERGIDALKTKIQTFAVTASNVPGVPKVIINDEGDNFTQTSIQALRGLIEGCSANARFIFTVNYPQKLTQPVLSRLQVINFTWDREESVKLMKQFALRVFDILKQENIEIDSAGQKAVIEYIKRVFPDMRRILEDLQLYSYATKKIDEGFLFMLDESKFIELYKILKEKNYKKAQSFVKDLGQKDMQFVYTQFFNDLEKFVKPKSIPEAVLIIDRYQFKSSFAPNQEIPLMACICEFMSSLEFV